MVFREGRTKAVSWNHRMHLQLDELLISIQVGNILKPLPHTNTNMNRTKPTKMQARGGGAQNQQNQNPNVGATSSAPTVNSNEVKANLDSVLEISVDKRNVKSNNRGGKRKRNNLNAGSEPGDGAASTSSVQ